MEEVQGFRVARYQRVHPVRSCSQHPPHPLHWKSFKTTGEAHAETVVTGCWRRSSTNDIHKPEARGGRRPADCNR